MPHRDSFLLNGEEIPSVSEITDVLSKDGLMRNFFRKLGFDEADRQSEEARKQGTSLASMFEKYRVTGKLPKKITPYNETCAKNWLAWFESSPYIIKDDKYIEIQLVNTKEKYRGSPDLIMHDETTGEWILGDDKSKKRFASYSLLMNEHLYAACDSYVEEGSEEIKKLPWEPPIQTMWFFSYHVTSGKLYPMKHEFDPKVYEHALICRQMYDVNRRAEEYFKQFAVKLPEDGES